VREELKASLTDLGLRKALRSARNPYCDHPFGTSSSGFLLHLKGADQRTTVIRTASTQGSSTAHYVLCNVLGEVRSQKNAICAQPGRSGPCWFPARPRPGWAISRLTSRWNEWRKLRRPRAAASRIENRNVVKFFACRDATQHEPSSAHIPSSDEFCGKNQALAKNIEQRFHVLRSRDTA
jgi:hypothetical protein